MAEIHRCVQQNWNGNTVTMWNVKHTSIITNTTTFITTIYQHQNQPPSICQAEWIRLCTAAAAPAVNLNKPSNFKQMSQSYRQYNYVSFKWIFENWLKSWPTKRYDFEDRAECIMHQCDTKPHPHPHIHTSTYKKFCFYRNTLKWNVFFTSWSQMDSSHPAKRWREIWQKCKFSSSLATHDSLRITGQRHIQVKFGRFVVALYAKRRRRRTKHGKFRIHLNVKAITLIINQNTSVDNIDEEIMHRTTVKYVK